MNQHERATCEAIEGMLFAATGRQATGSVDDVLFQIICKSEFATMADYPSDGLGVDDAKKLASALWSVIGANQVHDPIMIGSTIPGISGDSTRFDFVEMWVGDLVCVKIPEVGSLDFRGAVSTETDVRRRFEEFLLSVVALYCVREVCNEFFGFHQIFPTMNEFCKALGDSGRISKVCECLLNVMTIVEDHYGL